MGRSYRQVLAVLATVALLAGPPVAAAPLSSLNSGASGAVEFLSRTPSGPTDFMAGGGTPTPITGTLALPPGDGRMVAMVILHASGGIRPGREGAWAARLLDLGIATHVIDSFTPRGIRLTADGQGRLPLATSVAEGFAALALLSTHPHIDPARIGVMGFSKGGQVALYTALESFFRAAGLGDRRFALHIALYASCSILYLSSAVSGAPVYFLLGSGDDYTPAAHCARYADWFAAKGATVTQVVYPGARHGFDTPDPVQTLPRVQTARACGLEIELEPLQGRRWDSGAVVPNGEIEAVLRRCMQRGASFGGHALSRELAIAAVRDAVHRDLLHSR